LQFFFHLLLTKNVAVLEFTEQHLDGLTMYSGVDKTSATL